MPSDETFDRLHAAARCLTRDGSIKERLLDAWSGHLEGLDPETLPADMRAAYIDAQFALQSTRPQHGETAVRASVRKMSGADASRYAALVIDLFAEFARARVSASAPRQAPQRVSAISPIVELFAAEG